MTTRGPKIPKIILASKSPRRRALLEAAGFSFEVVEKEVEEQSPGEAEPIKVATENAHIKAMAVASSLMDASGVVVVGADTVVAIEKKLLGKPIDRSEARAMLTSLSGRSHQVVTGISLVIDGKIESLSHAVTEVTFRNVRGEEIESYTATNEPYDKAGGYAIQGLASAFIADIRGSYSNVVGLPLELLMGELERLSKVSIYHWVKQHVENR